MSLIKNVFLAEDALAMAFKEIASAISVKDKYPVNVVAKSDLAEEVADADKAKAPSI